ncbi:MAG TPA: hypothetical protein VMS77_00315 [Conexivisphaerales archaeon]|nr:hypothetical protein [Conexivisphaerales archaeon]
MNIEAKTKPQGVTAIAMIDAIGGALSAFLGFWMLTLTPQLVAQLQQDSDIAGAGAGVIASSVQLVASFFLVVGALGIVNAYGLWKAKNWAWWMAVIMALLGALSSALVLPMGIVSLAIELLIVYYLTRRHVRDYFRPVAETLPASTA